MPENAAPAPVTPEPTKIPPPIAAGPNGAAALAEGDKGGAPANPFEFDLDVKGQKQKLSFATKAQLEAVLQKALYADQEIKSASQAKKGAEALMQKMKAIGQGDVSAFKELMSDPGIGGDAKKIALALVTEMMDEEKLSPEEREMRDLKKYREETEGEKKSRAEAAEREKENQERMAAATETRGQIISAMKKYPDIPQDQATMDGVIQNMRAAFRRFGKHLTPDQAISVYSEQYWKSWGNTADKMDPETLLKRIPRSLLEKLQKVRLDELKAKTNPANLKPAGNPELKKKKSMTEREFDQHFQQLAGL